MPIQIVRSRADKHELGWLPLSLLKLIAAAVAVLQGDMSPHSTLGWSGDKPGALKRAKAIFRTVGEAAQMSCVMVGVLFIVYLLDVMMQMRLNIFGIQPRTAAGLVGIVCSPFLHANAAHLIANCSALLVLLFLLFLNRKYRAEETLLVIWLGSGFGTWLIGRPSIHIGASSIIYGLIVYLVAAGWWMKGWRGVVVALIVLFLYAGAVFGLLPRDSRISWEGHLAGAIVGWITAKYQHG